MKYLLVYPTHANLQEEFERYDAAVIHVATYPARTTVDTKLQLTNCWNTEADQAEAVGFSVGKTVCFRCEQREQCLQQGYLQQVITTSEADVALATHARVQYTSFEEMSDDRDYITVHEDPVQLLNPTVALSVADLEVVRNHLQQLLSDPFWLDWFGDGTTKDADGNQYDDKQKQIQRERYLQITHTLVDVVDELHQSVTQAQQSTAWEPLETIKLPAGYESFLWWTTKMSRRTFNGTPWRFLLSAIRGDLQRSTIIVVHKHVAGMQQGTTRLQKTILGVRENHPPQGKTVWFNDATLTIERLQGILGRPVQNGTPNGCLDQKKFSFQYVRDITRKTSLDVTVALMRGVLAKHQHYRRVGVITHRPQLNAIEKLEEFFRQRIVMSTYYGSGEERSSNAWYQECDLILVLGTPRVPSQAVMEYLIQVGEQRIACTEPTWDDVLWQATTHRGELKTLTGRGYHEERWRAAHRDLVRAALIQAIGRGRTVLEDGCDVIVLSNEECGLMVIDDETPRINDSAMEVFEKLKQLTMEKSNILLLEKTIVSTSEVAQRSSLSEVRVREHLRDLESFHLIQRHGQRSGWSLSPVPNSSPTSSPDPSKEIPHARCH